MLRIFLIVLAIALGGGMIWLGRDMPIRADMKRWAQILIGLNVFFALFFLAVRIIDHYGWWLIPTFMFVVAAFSSLDRLGAINRLIDRNKPDQWLRETLAAAGTASAMIPPTQPEEKMHTLEDKDVDLFADYEPEQANRPRRFMDDFVIADEADLGPGELELDRLNQFIFTSRHGFLVHNRGPELAACDVTTIHPGMSIADLIDAAAGHHNQCDEEAAA